MNAKPSQDKEKVVTQIDIKRREERRFRKTLQNLGSSY
jgi:hypothetical protein